MLWSQYKLATIIHTEFLHEQITGISNFANRNSNFLTLQTLEFQKKNSTGIFGIKNGISIPLTMGVPEIGTKNWNSQPSLGGGGGIGGGSGEGEGSGVGGGGALYIIVPVKIILIYRNFSYVKLT